MTGVDQKLKFGAWPVDVVHFKPWNQSRTTFVDITLRSGRYRKESPFVSFTTKPQHIFLGVLITSG